jgi:hypothetical protein
MRRHGVSRALRCCNVAAMSLHSSCVMADGDRDASVCADQLAINVDVFLLFFGAVRAEQIPPCLSGDVKSKVVRKVNPALGRRTVPSEDDPR